MFRPMASSGSNPNSVVAAGFQPDTRSSRSIVTIATGLTSTSDSKYDFCRSSSAVRSWTRRSRVATFSRSSAVISSNATASVPTSSSDWIPDTASRSPAVTLAAVAASCRIGRVTRRATNQIPPASRTAETSPTSPMTSASWRADAERLVLADLGEESGAAVGEPAVDPDDRDTAVVDVQALAGLAGADLADALGVDGGAPARPGCAPWMSRPSLSTR